jgi:hypothetical protein
MVVARVQLHAHCCKCVNAVHRWVFDGANRDLGEGVEIHQLRTALCLAFSKSSDVVLRVSIFVRFVAARVTGSNFLVTAIARGHVYITLCIMYQDLRY